MNRLVPGLKFLRAPLDLSLFFNRKLTFRERAEQIGSRLLDLEDELLVADDVVVQALGLEELLVHHLGLGPDQLLAHLGDLGLGLVQPLPGELEGFVVVSGLVSQPGEHVGELVGSGDQLVVPGTEDGHLLGDLRLLLLQAAGSNLDAKFVQVGKVFLRSWEKNEYC